MSTQVIRVAPPDVCLSAPAQSQRCAADTSFGSGSPSERSTSASQMRNTQASLSFMMIAELAAAYEAPNAPHYSAGAGAAVAAGPRISAAIQVMPTLQFQPAAATVANKILAELRRGAR